MVWKGIVISESLKEPSFINEFKVYKVEISKEEENIINENRKARWHLYWVKAKSKQIKQLAQEQLKQGWYTHFWNNKREILVIFSGKKFKINFDNKETWKEAVEYGKSLGIPEHQLDFPIEE
jgi:hypothetical protein